MEKISSFLRQLSCAPIIFYQVMLRPVLRPCCRFHPSCSDYALDSIRYHGLFRGFWLTGYRLLRCHPWSVGGYDPVLPKKEKV